jgi:peptidoglycan/LPS O-acetylase OafA/YrhL
MPGLSAPQLAILTLVATLPFALLSWHLVESPALQRSPAKG